MKRFSSSRLRVPLISALVGVLLAGCTSQSAPESEQLLAPNISVTQLDGFTFGFVVQGLSLEGGDEGYTWRFGDGHGAAGRAAEHTYGAEGRYEVTLEVAADTRYTLTRYVSARPLGLRLRERTPSMAQSGSSAQRTFTLENTSDAPLAWRLEAEHAPTNPSAGRWFEASPAAGTLTAGTSVQVALEPKRSLAPGHYASSLALAHREGTLTIDLAAQVGQPQPRLLLSAPRAVVARGRSEAGLSVRASGFGGDVYLSTQNVPDFLNVQLPDPKISDTEAALLRVEPAQRAPLGEHDITLQATGGGADAEVTLTVEVLARSAGRARVTGQVKTDNTAIPIPKGKTADGDTEGTSADTQSVTPTQPAFVPGQLLVQYQEAGAFPLSQTGVGQAARGSHEYSTATQSLKKNRAALTAEVAQSYGLSVLRRGASGQPDLMELTPGRDVRRAADDLARDPRVLFAEPNYYLDTLGSLPNDPLLPEQWALAAAGVPAAWNAAPSAKGVVVAVVDTGFDLGHPDLGGRFLPGYDFCAQDTGACGALLDANPGSSETYNGHGTHVAGLIGALQDNGVGVAGVAPEVDLLPVKVFNDAGEGATSASVIRGIHWAAGLDVEGAPRNANPARIINMSLGGTFKSNLIQKAVNDARRAGALLVAATGNDGEDRLRTPAAAENVLGVGAVNTSFQRACFSNYGKAGEFGPGAVDLMAPGGDGCGDGRGLISTLPGDYGEQAGTSMAAPIVSGLAALVLAQDPELSVEELEAKLLGATYFDDRLMNPYSYGAGVIRGDKLFGLPGPGDEVTVKASGEDSGAVDYVKLDLYGGSEPFELKGLRETRHTLEVTAGSTRRAFENSKDVKLAVGEFETDITLPLAPR